MFYFSLLFWSILITSLLILTVFAAAHTVVVTVGCCIRAVLVLNDSTCDCRRDLEMWSSVLLLSWLVLLLSWLLLFSSLLLLIDEWVALCINFCFFILASFSSILRCKNVSDSEWRDCKDFIPFFVTALVHHHPHS